VPLSEQFARQSDSISAIDALDRIARSQDLGGVPGAWRLLPKTDDQDRRSRQTIGTLIAWVGNVFWHRELPEAQCERDRALLAVCCSGPSQFESGTPT